MVRGERDVARRDAEGARAALAAFTEELRKAQDDAAAVRKASAPFGTWSPIADSRTARLAALPPAGKAVGRVVWDPGSRRAVLLVTGLDPAPEGKAYEVWVIADAAPVPAGVFRPRPMARGLQAAGRRRDGSRAKTFAVTLEPEADEGADGSDGPRRFGQLASAPRPAHDGPPRSRDVTWRGEAVRRRDHRLHRRRSTASAFSRGCARSADIEIHLVLSAPGKRTLVEETD